MAVVREWPGLHDGDAGQEGADMAAFAPSQRPQNRVSSPFPYPACRVSKHGTGAAAGAALRAAAESCFATKPAAI